MSDAYLKEMFGLEGQVAVVTGGTGVLGGAMALGLARAGARVALVGRRQAAGDEAAARIRKYGADVMVVTGDVLVREEMERVRDEVVSAWGRIDILVNAAGGATAGATVPVDKTFFDLEIDPLSYAVQLNLFGTILPSQVLGEVLARQKQGSIINISSMNAQRPLTRAIAYSAAKAAIDNFTRWLAVEMALKFGPGLRVNAIVPGFFLGEQNRALLTNEDGSLTPRGQKIIEHTPAGRFGEPDELVGALVWLCSPSARFVNGTLVVVDGGVSAYAGI